MGECAAYLVGMVVLGAALIWALCQLVKINRRIAVLVTKSRHVMELVETLRDAYDADRVEKIGAWLEAHKELVRAERAVREVGGLDDR